MPVRYRRFVFLTLLLTLSGTAPASGDVSYAPPYCNFSVTVPGPAHVEDHRGRDGTHALQAVTDANEPPLFIAQCTPTEGASVSTALKDRLKQAADGVQSFGGRDVQATTVKDARGEWAKATGTAIIGGRTIHVTVMNLAGKSSLLYLMGGTEKAEDQVRFDHMVQSVTAKANK